MTAALVALGSNLGDRRQNLQRAVALLAATPGIQVKDISRLRATRPIGGPAGQMEFLNGAALLETSLSPEQLRAAMAEVETVLGRVRPQTSSAWGSRTIDLDLLLYGQETIETPDLIVPHPRMAFRRFVIEPAAEIAPDWRHPTIGWTMAELRDHLRDAPNYIAIAGPIGVGKSALAADVAALTSGRLLTDPAGRSPERQIELLESREKQLARSTWPPDDRPTISDYWFNQSLWFAEQTLGRDDLIKFADRWQLAVGRIVQPKLLVSLDAGQAAAEPDEALQLLWSMVSRPGCGPLLRLDAAKPEAARTELAAAIDAMRP